MEYKKAKGVITDHSPISTSNKQTVAADLSLKPDTTENKNKNSYSRPVWIVLLLIFIIVGIGYNNVFNIEDTPISLNAVAHATQYEVSEITTLAENNIDEKVTINNRINQCKAPQHSLFMS